MTFIETLVGVMKKQKGGRMKGGKLDRGELFAIALTIITLFIVFQGGISDAWLGEGIQEIVQRVATTVVGGGVTCAQAQGVLGGLLGGVAECQTDRAWDLGLGIFSGAAVTGVGHRLLEWRQRRREGAPDDTTTLAQHEGYFERELQGLTSAEAATRASEVAEQYSGSAARAAHALAARAVEDAAAAHAESGRHQMEASSEQSGTLARRSGRGAAPTGTSFIQRSNAGQYYFAQELSLFDGDQKLLVVPSGTLIPYQLGEFIRAAAHGKEEQAILDQLKARIMELTQEADGLTRLSLGDAHRHLPLSDVQLTLLPDDDGPGHGRLGGRGKTRVRRRSGGRKTGKKTRRRRGARRGKKRR